MLACVLSLIAYSKCLLIGLKKWFLVEKALYEHVDVLLPLAINGIADGAVRRWKGCKELLEHLILVESIFHPRVNSFDMPGEALNVCPRILNASVFRHLICGKLAEILSAYGGPLFIISL
jgi:hypothetical protein